MEEKSRAPISYGTTINGGLGLKLGRLTQYKNLEKELAWSS